MNAGDSVKIIDTLPDGQDWVKNSVTLQETTELLTNDQGYQQPGNWVVSATQPEVVFDGQVATITFKAEEGHYYQLQLNSVIVGGIQKGVTYDNKATVTVAGKTESVDHGIVLYDAGGTGSGDSASPTPTPTPTDSATPTPTPTDSANPSPSETATATPTETPMPITSTSTPTQSPAPAPGGTPAPFFGSLANTGTGLSVGGIVLITLLIAASVFLIWRGRRSKATKN